MSTESNAGTARLFIAAEEDSAVADLAGFTHRYADVNGARIHYVVGGEGPAVVLVHGWPYTWAEWRKLMPLIAQAGFTVIAPDLRGIGDSAKPETGYAKLNVAEDIRQIAQMVRPGPVNLVGTDIGAMVAYAYAANHPDEVRRLVLAESLIPGFGLEDRMNPATGGYWHFGFQMQVGLAAMLTSGKEAAYLSPLWQMMSISKDALEVATSSYLPYYGAPGGMRGGFEHYGSLLEDGKQNRATFRGKLKMPVLVLSGDKGLPSAQTIESVDNVAQNVESAIVPNSGHVFAADNPSWVAAKLSAFFR